MCLLSFYPVVLVNSKQDYSDAASAFFTTVNFFFIISRQFPPLTFGFYTTATKAFIPCESKIRTKILMTDVYLLVGS